MKKLFALFVLVYLGSAALAPAKLAPGTTITVRVVYLNQSVFPPRIDPAVGAAVNLMTIYPGLIRNYFQGSTNAQGEITFAVFYPPTNPTYMGMSATATFGTLHGTAAQSTPLPTNPWLLSILAQ